jgi:hypothetical protein
MEPAASVVSQANDNESEEEIEPCVVSEDDTEPSSTAASTSDDQLDSSYLSESESTSTDESSTDDDDWAPRLVRVFSGGRRSPFSARRVVHCRRDLAQLERLVELHGLAKFVCYKHDFKPSYILNYLSIFNFRLGL